LIKSSFVEAVKSVLMFSKSEMTSVSESRDSIAPTTSPAGPIAMGMMDQAITAM
tara:strand:- start:2989 stop:3150 length:162 start_codon:yes stop_codon:yes gene_type:complete